LDILNNYYDHKPAFIIDENLNIVDKNLAASEYFRTITINSSNKKIFQIFPNLKTIAVLDFIAKIGKIELLAANNKIKAKFYVNKLDLKENDVYLFSLIDTKIVDTIE
jgi:hypothetical protein